MWFHGFEGSYCTNCFDPLDAGEMKRTAREKVPFCNSCEEERLLTKEWLEEFLVKLQRWHLWGLFEEEQRGYN